jgi:capsular exopolysaccharide synthesis family protein
MTNRPAGFQKPTQGGIHLGDYLRVIYRRRWSAALALLVVFVYTAFHAVQQTPFYQATAQILIDGESTENSLDSVLARDRYIDEDFFQTQYRILRSRSLAWRTAQALGLATPEDLAAAPPPSVQERPGMVDGVVEWAKEVIGVPERIEPPPADETTMQAMITSRVLSGLWVSPVRGTRLIEIGYASDDPVFAAKAANAFVDQYIDLTLESRVSYSKEALAYLNTQLEEQRQRVSESEWALQQYKEDNDAIGVDDQQNIVVQRLAALNAQYTQARADRIDKETLFTTLTSLENRDALDAFPAVMNNGLVQQLRADLGTLRQERSQLAARYREGAPQIENINTRIQEAERKLQAEVGTVVDSIRNDLAAARAREESLRQELDRQKGDALRLNRKGVEYAALRDEAASTRQLYETLLQRSSETGVSGQFRGSNVRIIDRAEVPRSPYKPDLRRDLRNAFLTGCLIAIIVAFGFEYLDSRIRTPDEIKSHLGLPFLGLVPAVSLKDTNGDTPLLTSAEVPGAFGEAIRAVRTAVMFSSAVEGARSIVVTSTGPGEGKTLVAANLALALAQADQRTLLIDADMRRPRVHEVYPVDQEPGLSNVLVGGTDVTAAISKTLTPNLNVLAAGHLPPNPAELLGSPKYRALIEELRRDFDWIIVDAPPVMAVTDAAVVANGATGVVFVVGAEMTSRRNALAAVERLNAAQAHFIGGVLNRADVQRHSYYYSTHYRKDYTQAYVRSR